MNISNYQVMKSAAGYYVGLGYSEDGMGIPEGEYPLPYERCTDYMTEAQAESMCEQWLQEEAEDAAYNDSKEQMQTRLIAMDGE